jgi:bloom syndrome protein
MSFRKDYSALATIRRKHIPHAKITALTATATPHVQQDILRKLGLSEQTCNVFKTNVNKPNIMYSVLKKNPGDQAIDQIYNIINEKYKDDTGIVYCLSKEDTRKVEEALHQKGLKVARYTGGGSMSRVELATNEKRWRNGEVKVMVATIAFGMGIDKADVRYVIHHSVPKGLEDFFQQSGRAGRDGKPAESVILYSAADINRNISLVERDASQGEANPNLSVSLEGIQKYCKSIQCRRSIVVKYFSPDEEFECDQMCDNCKNATPLDLYDLTEHAINLIKIVRATNGFPEGHVIKIWRGSRDKKVTKYNHQNLPAHGSAKGKLDLQLAQDIINEMVEQGYLYVTRKRSQTNNYIVFRVLSVNDQKANHLFNPTSNRRFLMKMRKLANNSKYKFTLAADTHPQVTQSQVVSVDSNNSV